MTLKRTLRRGLKRWLRTARRVMMEGPGGGEHRGAAGTNTNTADTNANPSATTNANAAASVRRCRLTVSEPVLKAPVVSALGTIMSQTAFKLCFQNQLAPPHLGAQRVGVDVGVQPGQLRYWRGAGAYTRRLLSST